MCIILYVLISWVFISAFCYYLIRPTLLLLYLGANRHDQLSTNTDKQSTVRDCESKRWKTERSDILRK